MLSNTPDIVSFFSPDLYVTLSLSLSPLPPPSPPTLTGRPQHAPANNGISPVGLALRLRGNKTENCEPYQPRLHSLFNESRTFTRPAVRGAFKRNMRGFNTDIAASLTGSHTACVEMNA